MKISKQFIPLVKGIDLCLRRIPLIVVDSQKTGPVIWLAAAIHGDEVTGTAIIHSLIKKFRQQTLKRGKIYCLPIMNPTGFETISRKEAYAEADLNRSFGGKTNGTIAERHAALISQTILKSQADYVIDLHADSMNSIAYTIVDDLENQKLAPVFKRCCCLADILGFPWAIDKNSHSEYPLEKSLSGYLVSNNITAVTVELGTPLVVVESFKTAGLEAIWRLLIHLKMVKGSPLTIIKTKQPLVFYEKIRAQSTGIITYRVKAGDTVVKNQIMAKIKNAFGKTIETILSPVNGRIFSHEDQSIVFPGQELFVVAT